MCESISKYSVTRIYEHHNIQNNFLLMHDQTLKDDSVLGGTENLPDVTFYHNKDTFLFSLFQERRALTYCEIYWM